jgi:hypothetical protein
MRDRGRSFFRCQSGAVVSAELVVVGTMVVIGLITGLSAVQNSINSELLDLSSAFNALDQSYGFTGYEAVSRTRRLAWTAPSSWYDTDEQASDRPLQMRALEPRSEGPVRGGQPSGQAPRGNRGAGGGPGGPGAASGPPARGTGRGGPDAEAATGDEQLREETGRFCHQTNCEQLGSGRRLSTRRHLIRVPSIQVRNLRSVMRVPCITRGRVRLRCTHRRDGRVLIRTIRRGLRDIVATVWVVEK